MTEIKIKGWEYREEIKALYTSKIKDYSYNGVANVISKKMIEGSISGETVKKILKRLGVKGKKPSRGNYKAANNGMSRNWNRA